MLLLKYYDLKIIKCWILLHDKGGHVLLLFANFYQSFTQLNIINQILLLVLVSIWVFHFRLIKSSPFLHCLVFTKDFYASVYLSCSSWMFRSHCAGLDIEPNYSTSAYLAEWEAAAKYWQFLSTHPSSNYHFF